MLIMSKFVPVTHVIFDLDGTLTDTESILTNGLKNVITKYNKEEQFSREIEIKSLGSPFKERAQQIWNDIQLEIDFKQFINELISTMLSDVGTNGMRLMSGAEKLVKHLYDNKIPLAIASGNTTASFNETRARFGNFFDYFHHFVFSADDKEVIKHKPHPDVFLVAAKRFSPEPQHMKHVLVFEDSQVGVDAAIAAGMQCVYVPDARIHIKDFDDCNATTVIASLNHFEPDLFHLPNF